MYQTRSNEQGNAIILALINALLRLLKILNKSLNQL